MITWTPAAHEELSRHLDSVRARLAVGATADGPGADPNEVVDDLRRHVDAEFADEHVSVVTVADVRRVLSRIGLPEADAPDGSEQGEARSPRSRPNGDDGVSDATAGRAAPASGLSSSSSDHVGFAPSPSQVLYPRKAAKGPTATGTAAIVLFGVLTPMIAVVVEAATGMCAQTLFDPFPTAWHLGLVAVVPVANFAMLLAGTAGVARRPRAYNLLNGFAIGVALFYALIFLPIAPVAVIAIVGFGMGLLPLSPLTGLMAALSLRRRYVLGTVVDPQSLAGFDAAAAAKPAKRKPRARGGMALAALALIALHLPSAVTHLAMSKAASATPETRARGLWLLRAVGREEVMRRECYARRGEFGDGISEILTLGTHLPPAAAQEVYYRATGEPYNARPRPAGTFGRRDRSRGAWDESNFDGDRGGDAVAGRIRDLSLTESRFDGVVDGDGAWAYGEWTMVFRNDTMTQQEARAQILLPAGGVVSRLTLWVDGEPREAAFAGRARVKAAYKEVAIVQRRDPVLVTTAGPDRVLMQCFPVPPNHGTMKVRVGVTYPLQLARIDRATFGLPAIVERNFSLKPALAHSVWLESSAPLADASGLLRAENPKPKSFAVRGELTDAQLTDMPAALSAARDPNVRTTWAEPPAQVKEAGGPIVQEIAESVTKPPSQVVMVLDASRGMAPHVSDVASTLASLPAGVALSVVLADDQATLLTPEPVVVSGDSVARVGEQLRKVKCVGGQDAVPALCRAWDLASQSPDGAIVWVHGPQPMLLDGVEALEQRYERRPDGPRLLMLQAVPGPNRVCEAMDRQGDISRLPRAGTPADDLRRLFYSWSQTAPSLRVSRARATTRPTADGAKQTAPHVARLWANDEVRKVAQSNHSPAGATATEATRLAAAYQLVTPLTGAVVLETKAQYDANGLTPVDPSSVPTVPEPETVVLLIVVAAAVAWAIYKRRRHVRA